MSSINIGLEILRDINYALNHPYVHYKGLEVKDTRVSDGIIKFMEMDSNKLYMELIESNSYIKIVEFNRHLKLIENNLYKELKYLKDGSFEILYENSFINDLKSGMNILQRITDEISNHLDKTEKLALKYNPVGVSLVRKIAYENPDSDEYFDYEVSGQNLVESFSETAQSLSSLSVSIKKMFDKRTSPYSYNDFKILLKEFITVTNDKLIDLSEKGNVFKKEVVVELAYEIFVGYNLIETIDRKDFEDQIRYRNRTLTFKSNQGKKIILAQVIYRLKPFVSEDYQEEWENQMISLFNIKSYKKIRNKALNSIELDEIKELIKTWKTLLSL